MINLITDRNILDKFVIEFTNILEKHAKYVVVSGFVAIANGRVRGTEDVDLIVESTAFPEFKAFFEEIYLANFECIQSDDVSEVYNDYLVNKEIIRFCYNGMNIPNIEFKFPKNKIDEYTLSKRTKLPLTGLDIYFASVESTIAYKESHLCSEKDFEDACHLRWLYREHINHDEIEFVREMINECFCSRDQQVLKDSCKVIYYSKRDKTHTEFIERWVDFMKTHAFSEWKKQQSDFLDSQIVHSMEFYQRLLKEPNGSEKARELLGWQKERKYWFER